MIKYDFFINMNERIVCEPKIQQETDLTVNAKSFILVESLDKIANVTLSENMTIINEKHVLIERIIKEDLKENIQQPDNAVNKQLITHSNKMKIGKKYFKLWKTKVKQKKKMRENDKKEKIIAFLEKLRKHQKPVQDIKETNKIQSPERPNFIKKRQEDVSEIYKSRYKAQQNLILSQKVKLQEQEKVIENLKLGIIVEETEKSLENSKYEIREIFRSCSERVKCKVTPPEVTEKDLNIIELRTSRAPKIIAQMEKRAEEREIRRNIILQKKKMMEETKRKQIEGAIARKKATDEEERQKSLEAIKERRRLEAELDKRRQLNRQKYLESINKANKFYNKKLKRLIFNAFKTLIEMKCEYEVKSELFYERLLKQKSLNNWKIYVKEKLEKEYMDADIWYEYKVKRKAYKCWRLVLVHQKQSMQVAEDLYDMKLQSRSFLHWHRYTCRQQMIEYKNLQVANKHYNGRILLQYFYQWKSLPAVLQLEKAKEEKKRKWREKVWEIIPDYQPYTEVI